MFTVMLTNLKDERRKMIHGRKEAKKKIPKKCH